MHSHIYMELFRGFSIVPYNLRPAGAGMITCPERKVKRMIKEMDMPYKL